MIDKKTYKKYLKALNLPVDVELTEDNIKQAFKLLAKENHPDRFTNVENKELAKKKFQVFNKYQDYLLTNLIDYNKLIRSDRPFEEKSITELRKELSEKIGHIKEMESSLKDLKRKNKDTKEFIEMTEKEFINDKGVNNLLQYRSEAQYGLQNKVWEKQLSECEEVAECMYCFPWALLGLAWTALVFFCSMSFL